MSFPPFLRAQGDAVMLSVKVQPRAGRTEMAGILNQELKVRVAAPPVDSAANEALVEFIAKSLGLPRRAVTLVRGQTSKHKVIQIEGMSLEGVAERLGG
ncbi:MAG: YggU family protein [Verrucomicrobiales bacterium]|nr:YggU family protein [Verrucomicrobiales bacterium]